MRVLPGFVRMLKGFMAMAEDTQGTLIPKPLNPKH